MPDDYAKTRYTKREIAAIMRNGVRACNGAGPDTYGFARIYWGAIAYSLFSDIHTAFLAKSNHGRDELGFSWVDLTPKYKTYSRMDAREGIPLPGPKYRPTLTLAQDKAWRGVFARIAHRLKTQGYTTKRERAHMKRSKLDKLRKSRRKASHDMAAAVAWTFVKERMGAHPLIELVPPRKVPLLQVTHRLEQSLSPSPLTADGAYKPVNRDQVWRVQQGQLTLGTKVPYADYVDPKRNLWPRNISIWMDRANGMGRDVILQRLKEVVEQG